MTSRQWQDDDRLLSEMVGEAERAALPDSIRRAARRAFAGRAAGRSGVLAEISYDSLLDVFRVRGELPGGGRILSFEAGDLSVEVEILGEGVTGQLVPVAAGRVQMLTLDGVAAETTADALGRFVLARPGTGPVPL